MAVSKTYRGKYHIFTRGPGKGSRGIRAFRSPVFSLLGAKVPSGNLRSQERMLPGTFAPGSECSHWELSFLPCVQ